MDFSADELEQLERRLQQQHDALIHLGYEIPRLAREALELQRKVREIRRRLDPPAHDAAEDKAAIVQPASPAV